MTKHLIAVVFAATLLGAASAPAVNAAPIHRSQMVLATWFSNTKPKVGKKEAVYVQFFSGHTKFAGASLSVTITGLKPALHLRGNKTNKQGMAWARFTVPGSARGHRLLAHTTVSYKGKRYTGMNQVTVGR